MNLLAFEMFVKDIVLATAKGMVQITFLHLKILFLFVLLFLVVMTQKSSLLLSTVMTC